MTSVDVVNDFGHAAFHIHGKGGLGGLRHVHGYGRAALGQVAGTVHRSVAEVRAEVNPGSGLPRHQALVQQPAGIYGNLRHIAALGHGHGHILALGVPALLVLARPCLSLREMGKRPLGVRATSAPWSGFKTITFAPSMR